MHQECTYFSVQLLEYRELIKCQKAWHHEDMEELEGQCKYVLKEFNVMINKGVWRKHQRRNMPPNRYLIDSKRAFKNKLYGRFRTRFVELGYTQIPGGDFTKNYPPLATCITICIILLMQLINKWDYHTIDFHTEFLYAVLKE